MSKLKDVKIESRQNCQLAIMDPVVEFHMYVLSCSEEKIHA